MDKVWNKEIEECAKKSSCIICGKELGSDLKNVGFSKTNRHSIVFFHNECVGGEKNQ